MSVASTASPKRQLPRFRRSNSVDRGLGRGLWDTGSKAANSKVAGKLALAPSNIGRMSRLERITTDPAICHGKPTVRGLRYPVETLLELLASGMTTEEILADYPELERDDVLAATPQHPRCVASPRRGFSPFCPWAWAERPHSAPREVPCRRAAPCSPH